MKIVWIVNIPLPEASLLLGDLPLPYGGWLVNASKRISQISTVQLSILFPRRGIKGITILKGDTITYYPFKETDNTSKNSPTIENILSEIKPDLVHVFGTELPHSIKSVEACERLNLKIVVSIQGLVSVITRHLAADLPFNAIYGITLRNLILRDNIRGLRKLYKKRGVSEIKALRKVDYAIGRTEWDRACTVQINPRINYFNCNETLREIFYTKQWDIANIERNSIFLSQGQYSLKGIHKVIDAMPTILKSFPNTKIYVSGKDIFTKKTIKDKFLFTYYAKFINNKIKKLKLQDHIIFTGPLDEHAMCERYLKSHVFICPSALENSPNSLGEAMILGVPSIASFVGGVPDLLAHKEEGYLYQFESEYMIAHFVTLLFSNDAEALRISKNGRKRALQTHNEEINSKRLMSIYEDIHIRNS